ncbi:MAG: heavy metal translocating P-type ATPase [Bdellovibrionota bacterium]
MFSLHRNSFIAVGALLGILLNILLFYAFGVKSEVANIPLFLTLAFGGFPLVYGLIRKALKKEFGADLLAGISIVTSIVLGEYMAGSIVVLMLAGGETLEDYALASASSVLKALANRIPSFAHRKNDSQLEEVPLQEIKVDDVIVVYPHETCPVDGLVLEGHGSMNEAYLTGEPFEISKTQGSTVISGAINGASALTIRTTHKAIDSRYAKITRVMQESEQKRPRIRRIGDQIGAYYTPFALLLALLAWGLSGDPLRFLAVLVVATPCPLLIAIPIAIMGSISLAARRSIIIKDPVVLEQISQCRTAIFDKTGTLTYGEPNLEKISLAVGFDEDVVLQLVASIERYSKHPLSRAILKKASERNLALIEATQVKEPPGQGIKALVSGRQLQITSRSKLLKMNFAEISLLPPQSAGLECVVLVDDKYAATFQFFDSPRVESKSFLAHLGSKHSFDRVMIISGDRESEVRYLAKQVGVKEVFAEKTPEEKLSLVRAETLKSKTLYVGDGINDAPAMMAATVGMAIGENSEVTSEAARVVIMDNDLKRVDEFMHISQHMFKIVLQSAIGGMLLSLVGMIFAALGYLSPVNGAICQEIIDVFAILNALRAAFPPKVLSDFERKASLQ